MASFISSPTDVKAIGALGGLYAGRDAADIDLMRRQQSVADLFDAQQKQETLTHNQLLNPMLRQQQEVTNLSALLKHGQAVSADPTVRLQDQLLRSNLQAKVDQPGLPAALAYAEFADATKKGDEFKEWRTLAPQRQASEKQKLLTGTSEARAKELGVAVEQLMAMGGVDNDATRAYLSSDEVNPQAANFLRQAMSRPGGLKVVQAALKDSTDHLRQVQLKQMELDKAWITASAQINSAERQAQAAIAASDRNAASLLIGTLTQSYNNMKAVESEWAASLHVLMESFKKDPTAADKHPEVIRLRKKLTDAAVMSKEAEKNVRKLTELVLGRSVDLRSGNDKPEPTGSSSTSTSATIKVTPEMMKEALEGNLKPQPTPASTKRDW